MVERQNIFITVAYRLIKITHPTFRFIFLLFNGGFFPCRFTMLAAIFLQCWTGVRTPAVYVISTICAKSLLINCHVNDILPLRSSLHLTRQGEARRDERHTYIDIYRAQYLTSAGRNFSPRYARAPPLRRELYSNPPRNRIEKSPSPVPPLLYIVSIVVAVSLALGIISLLLMCSLFHYRYSLYLSPPPLRPGEISRCEKKFLTKIGEIVPSLPFALIIGLPLSDEHECAFLAIRFTAVAATKRGGGISLKELEELSLAKRDPPAIIIARPGRVLFPRTCRFSFSSTDALGCLPTHRRGKENEKVRPARGKVALRFIKFLLFLLCRRARCSAAVGG